MANVALAVEKFYGTPDSEDLHLVVSTIPPKLRLGTEELSRFVNEGYSIVNGDEVVGDAGNGTYQPGIAATITSLQTTYPNLHLYQAPFDVSHVGEDDLHLTDEGYVAYAAGLQQLIEAEIGVTGGTINGTPLSLNPGTNVEGGQAGDLIIGSAASDIINGREGNDILQGLDGQDAIVGSEGRDRLEGGSGGDTVTGGTDDDMFVFNLDFADQGASPERDQITDFGTGADTVLFNDSFQGNITVMDDPQGSGVILIVEDGLGGVIGEILVEGAAAASLKGAAIDATSFELTTDDTLVSFIPDDSGLFA
jgi:Ca2+-binding RTX toxin-like protein